MYLLVTYNLRVNAAPAGIQFGAEINLSTDSNVYGNSGFVTSSTAGSLNLTATTMIAVAPSAYFNISLYNGYSSSVTVGGSAVYEYSYVSIYQLI